MRFSLPALAIALGIGVPAAGAADAGSIVIRFQTDPAPARVAWSYSGVGQAFQLRASGSTKTVSGVADGTYRLVEAGAAAGQAKTLTSLRCSDPSGGTTVDVASATAASPMLLRLQAFGVRLGRLGVRPAFRSTRRYAAGPPGSPGPSRRCVALP